MCDVWHQSKRGKITHSSFSNLSHFQTITHLQNFLIINESLYSKLPQPRISRLKSAVIICSYQHIHEWQTRLVLVKPNIDRSAILELNLVVVDLVDLDAGAIINHDTIVLYDALLYA